VTGDPLSHETVKESPGTASIPGSEVTFGHVSWCPPFHGAELARANELLGFDVQYFGDNSCVGSDPFAELREAASATETISLATGVTNFITRHPSVVAAGIAAVQIASAGRAICGIGKGDSAVAMIGRFPQRDKEFQRDLYNLRCYLHGETVPTGQWDSRLEWLSSYRIPSVPIEVMASGPKTLRAAAAFADRISLGVGAAPERVRWALSVIDEALETNHRSRSDVQVGAFLDVALAADKQEALNLLRPRVMVRAHMASFPGHELSNQPPILQQATERLRESYDYRYHHTDPTNPLAELISPELAHWFGIGGTATYLADRICELADIGVSYFVFASLPLSERELIAQEVMPAVRRAVHT
jgi:5,10-methylenetetrahydromethanopterin reductase